MTVSVDLVLDVVCPWCWLGHRYWDRARKLAGEIETETVLRPFQLDPAVPREGVDYASYMAKKFSGGSSERWKAMRDHLEAAGPEVGIVFNFDSIPKRPNTLDAHRVIRWAQGQGLGEEAADRLFKAFFEELRDIFPDAGLGTEPPRSPPPRSEGRSNPSPMSARSGSRQRTNVD